MGQRGGRRGGGPGGRPGRRMPAPPWRPGRPPAVTRARARPLRRAACARPATAVGPGRHRRSPPGSRRLDPARAVRTAREVEAGLVHPRVYDAGLAGGGSIPRRADGGDGAASGAWRPGRPPAVTRGLAGGSIPRRAEADGAGGAAGGRAVHPRLRPGSRGGSIPRGRGGSRSAATASDGRAGGSPPAVTTRRIAARLDPARAGRTARGAPPAARRSRTPPAARCRTRRAPRCRDGGSRVASREGRDAGAGPGARHAGRRRRPGGRASPAGPGSDAAGPCRAGSPRRVTSARRSVTRYHVIAMRARRPLGGGRLGSAGRTRSERSSMRTSRSMPSSLVTTPSTIATYRRSALPAANCPWRCACASGVFATTRRPEVSRSRRWTMKGRRGGRAPFRYAHTMRYAVRSRSCSVPIVRRPGGFSITRIESSSWIRRSGAARAGGGAGPSVTRSPAATGVRGSRTISPPTRTRPATSQVRRRRPEESGNSSRSRSSSVVMGSDFAFRDTLRLLDGRPAIRDCPASAKSGPVPARIVWKSRSDPERIISPTWRSPGRPSARRSSSSRRGIAARPGVSRRPMPWSWERAGSCRPSASSPTCSSSSSPWCSSPRSCPSGSARSSF